MSTFEQTLQQAHATRRPLLLDGAVGTELERRGVATPAPLWSAAALDSDPDAVTAIHAEYVAAGVAIVAANTFRVNPRTLAAVGRRAAGPALAAQAVQLARAANPRFVAASIAPVADCYRPDLVPDDATLHDEHNELIGWLVAAQPDLLWAETLGTVREARIVAEIGAATGLPLVLSFILDESGRLLGGEPLAEAVAAVEPHAPVALGLNCMPPSGLTRQLPRLRDLTQRPLAAYAHINDDRPLPGWTYAETAVSAAAYAAEAHVWSEVGAAIVGGCCGTTPAHLAAVAGRLA